MRVKVKKTRGVTGNQHNYGLVTGSIWNYEDKPTNNTVGTTLTPVPRDEANIEAERGETVVFPDADGSVAHAKIGGKRHSEGGTPLNVPDGSFVFSDFRGLLIKNKDVLKDIFNVGGSKSKTPAEIAKKYDINSYKEILKDPTADPMDKRTAQLMIENNMKKLGQLALIQEGMKGFPDGIPDIAAPLMGSDIAQGQPIPQQQQQEGQPPMARYGGLPKAQNGFFQNIFENQSLEQGLGVPKKSANDSIQNKTKPSAAATSAAINTPKANASVPAATPAATSNKNDVMHDMNVREQLYKAKQLWMNSSPNSTEEKRSRQYLINLLGENPEYAKLPSMQEFFNTVNNVSSRRPTYLKDLGKDLDKRKAVAEQRQQAEDKRIGLVNTLPDEDDPVKRKQVAAANKLYNEAVLSGDSDQMRKAAIEIDKLDISGKSTPVGMIGQFARGIGQVIAGIPSTVTEGNIEGLQPSNFLVNQPWGWTWQEKINDMRDQLKWRARDLETKKKENTAIDINTKNKQDYVTKYDQVKKKALEIINNPNSTTQELQDASTIYNDITNNDLYWPVPFSTRPLYNPFMSVYNNDPATQIIPKDKLEKQKQIDNYYNKLLGPNIKEAPTNINTYPESTYVDPKTGLTKAGAQPANEHIATKEQLDAASALLRQNKNAPVTKMTSDGKVVEFSRNAKGKIIAVYVPEKDVDKSTVDNSTKDKGKTNGNTVIKHDPVLGTTNYAPADTTGSYLWPHKEGGELSAYQKGGKHTQLIKETAIQNTPEYDVVMPNKKFGSFDTQHYDPATGYYTVTNPNTNTSEQLDLDDFVNRQSDVLKGYNNGIDGWKADVLSKDQATREKAAGWFQENYNTWRKANGLPEYFISKSGPNPYGKDNKLGIYTWSAPGIKKKTANIVENKTEDNKATKTTTQMGQIPAQNYESGVAGTPWWHYDLVNYGNQLANMFDVSPGELPTFMKYTPYIPDPTFVDPARAIAQQQGLVRGSQESIMSGADPTVGRANVIAAQAASAPQIANIMAQYDERNAGIANQYGTAGAQMLNQAQLQNQQFQKQYKDELEVRRQQYLNALREGRTDVAKSIMQGLKNSAETSWINATSDSYAVDPGTGNVYFKKGFDPLKGSFRSQTGSIADAYKDLLDQGWTDDQAKSILELQVRSKQPMTKNSGTGYQYGGMFNPMDLLWND
jgi:hypothetical protein